MRIFNIFKFCSLWDTCIIDRLHIMWIYVFSWQEIMNSPYWDSTLKWIHGSVSGIYVPDTKDLSRGSTNYSFSQSENTLPFINTDFQYWLVFPVFPRPFKFKPFQGLTAKMFCTFASLVDGMSHTYLYYGRDGMSQHVDWQSENIVDSYCHKGFPGSQYIVLSIQGYVCSKCCEWNLKYFYKN